MLTRWTRRLVIAGLAAFGAFKLIELVRLRVAPVKERATPHLHDAVERIQSAADDVAEDLTDVRQVIEDAAQDVSADLGDAAHEVKVGADAIAHDIKSVVVPPSQPTRDAGTREHPHEERGPGPALDPPTQPRST
jgi:hypothetical protein